MSLSVEQLLEQAAKARREGNRDDAFEKVNRALALSRQLDSEPDLALSLSSLGRLERDREELDAALQHYREAAAIWTGRGERLRSAHALRHMGDVHRELGNPEAAMTHCSDALAIYRQEQNVPSLDLANAIRSMAILNGEAGQLGAARSLWQEAGTLYAAAGIAEGVAECEKQLSQLT